MQQDDRGLRKPLHKQKPAVWQQISANIFTHREKKTQHEDDIMICACPKPANGKPGCGPHCLNRQLNIECHPVSAQPALLCDRSSIPPVAFCLQHTIVYTHTHNIQLCVYTNSPIPLSVHTQLSQNNIHCTARRCMLHCVTCVW